MSTDTWLIRTPRGWVEPQPPPCTCGSDRHLIGWTACSCGPEGGHRTWECKDCRHCTAVGCTGRVGKGPMDEYGVRTGRRA